MSATYTDHGDVIFMVLAAALVATTAIFLLLIISAPVFGSTVYGTVTVENEYSGTGTISGFVEGHITTLTLYNLTITYQGHIFTHIVACNLYPIGSHFPLIKQMIWGTVDAYSPLPPGCSP